MPIVSEKIGMSYAAKDQIIWDEWNGRWSMQLAFFLEDSSHRIVQNLRFLKKNKKAKNTEKVWWVQSKHQMADKWQLTVGQSLKKNQ